MRKPCIKDMLEGRESRYPLVIAVAKRAREITSEAEKNDEIITEKTVNLAIDDFRKGRYSILEPEINY